MSDEDWIIGEPLDEAPSDLPIGYVITHGVKHFFIADGDDIEPDPTATAN